MLNDGIEVQAARARTAGVALQQVTVRLPDLMREHAKLYVEGLAQGELPQMLAYTRASPVDGWLDGFLSTLDSSGQAQLKLGLTLPLDDMEAARVDGDVTLAGNTLQLRICPCPCLPTSTGCCTSTNTVCQRPVSTIRPLAGTAACRPRWTSSSVCSLSARGR